jgi:hypothetical protein
VSTQEFSLFETNVIARARDITLPGGGVCKAPFNALPGIIIFVHGVNSTGEWFDSTEAGLCQGLNERLHRSEFGQAQETSLAGLLRAARYAPELTPDGYLARTKSDTGVPASEFVSDEAASPVIRFRWGFAAHKEDLAEVGPNILLDEDNAWGGGPFANGCTALPDMWGSGTATDLLMGLTVQDLNTESSRLVFDCPPRHYQAHAAWRLAALVAEARKRHRNEYDGAKECPITIVCHSQGNMVGIASAFIGKAKFDGNGVADTYILANPPYGVLPNFFDNFGQYDEVTGEGRVTVLARRKTLDSFFGIVNERKGKTGNLASPACVDLYLSNKKAPWSHAQDQKTYPTHGNVFLYANPHDQVIGVASVMGMGWLGLPQAVLAGKDDDAGDKPHVFKHAHGVLYQRIWAQGNPLKYTTEPFKVGVAPGKDFVYYDKYHPERADTIQGKSGAFWLRTPLNAHVHFTRPWKDNRRSIASKIGATFIGGVITLGGIVIKVLTLGQKGDIPVNADPPDGWKVNINAHAVPNPVVPIAHHLYHPQTDATGQQPEDDGQARLDGGTPASGKVAGVFNQGPQSHTDALDRGAKTNDIYDQYRAQGQGGVGDEAALRYEHNASVRQLARGVEGNPFDNAIDQMRRGGDLSGEKHAAFRQFDQNVREDFLKQAVNLNASNHSTILTNPEHARRVLAYDVNVGLNVLPVRQMNWLRQFADWRYGDPKDPVMEEWCPYYRTGRLPRGIRLESHPDYKSNVPATLGIDTERSNSGSLSQTYREPQPEPVMPRERSPGEELRDARRAELLRQRQRPSEIDRVFGLDDAPQPEPHAASRSEIDRVFGLDTPDE